MIEAAGQARALPDPFRVSKDGYQPDIQGLRGLAVLMVILYHYKIPFFTGGFVGVDIFFVISGYLITRQILQASPDGRVRFRAYAVRRVQRLAPALLVTALATFVASALWLPPLDLSRISLAALLAPLGLSNVLFWSEAGYFDTASLRKPLLHTWSLAVEIQFYLFWPLVLMVAMRIGRVGLVIAGATLMSFVACLAMMTVSPATAFFMMPFRLFEFGFGAIAVVLHTAYPHRWRGSGVVAGVALAGLVGLSVLYDLVSFPGWAALPVVVASGLVIWLADKTRVGRVLSWTPLQSLGHVSYSAYLVHWPIWSLYNTTGLSAPGWGETALLLGLTAVLTLALYAVVERPLRDPQAWIWVRPGLTGVLGLALCAIPLHAYATRGWIWRVPSELVAVNDVDIRTELGWIWKHFDDLQIQSDYASAKPNLLVIGDSQAADYVNVLMDAGVTDHVDLITRAVFTTCNIPYLAQPRLTAFLETENPVSQEDPTWQSRCPELMQKATSGPAWDNADIIVVAYAWRDVSIPVIAQSFRDLAALTDAPLFVVNNKTFVHSPLELANRLGTLKGISKAAFDTVRPWTWRTNAVIADLPDVGVIDVFGQICGSDSCRLFNDNGQMLYLDETHLSPWGSKELAQRSAEALMPWRQSLPRQSARP